MYHQMEDEWNRQAFADQVSVPIAATPTAQA